MVQLRAQWLETYHCYICQKSEFSRKKNKSCPATSAPVNSKLCCCEMEASGSNNSSGNPQSETTECWSMWNSANLCCITHYWVPNCCWKQHQSKNFTKWVSMAEQRLWSLRTMHPGVDWSGVKHGTTGLQSSGNMFSGVMNDTILAVWWMNLCWGDAQRTPTIRIHNANSNLQSRNDNSSSCLRPLCSSEVHANATAHV